MTEEPIKKVLAEGESLWEGAFDSTNPFGRRLLPGDVADHPRIHPQISPRDLKQMARPWRQDGMILGDAADGRTDNVIPFIRAGRIRATDDMPFDV